MRVVWAVPCATISPRPEGGYDAELIGLTDAVVDALPSTIPFVLMIRLGALRDSIPETRRIAFDVFDSQGNVVFQHAGPATVENPSALAEEYELYSDVPMPFAFTAKTPGMHRLVISVEGEHAADVPLRVVLAG